MICLHISLKYCSYLCIFHTFINSQEALDVVHINKEDQENVFAMLAAVLWLGNVSFSEIDNENHVQAVEDEGKSFPVY